MNGRKWRHPPDSLPLVLIDLGTSVAALVINIIHMTPKERNKLNSQWQELKQGNGRKGFRHDFLVI
jgi:hypothetical protein